MPGLAIDKLPFSLQADLHNHQLTRLPTPSRCNLYTSFGIGVRVCPPTDIGVHATAQDTARDATVNVIREVGVPRLVGAIAGGSGRNPNDKPVGGAFLLVGINGHNNLLPINGV